MKWGVVEMRGLRMRDATITSLSCGLNFKLTPSRDSGQALALSPQERGDQTLPQIPRRALE